MTFNTQTKVLGAYENTDMLMFADCSTLTGGVQNPLTFVVPTNQWNAGVSCLFSNKKNEVGLYNSFELT